MAESVVNRVRVDKKGKAWFWLVAGVQWSYTVLPDRSLYRKGVDLTEEIERCKLLCVQEAVVYSLGYERSRDTREFGKGAK